MKKPVWVRFIGWIDVALWVCVGGGLWAFLHGAGELNFMIGWAFGGAVAVGVFVVWAFLSVVSYAKRHLAAQQAAALMAGPNSLGAASQGATVRLNHRKAPSAAPGTVVPECDRCEAASVLHCCRHESNLCWECVRAHDSDECTYIQSVRVVPHEVRTRELRRPATTSPLAGIR